MRVPLSWIRDFAPIDASPRAVADALNEAGLIVDAVDVPGRDVIGVVAARVLGVEDHPGADNLTLVDIDQGGRQTRVVCGARNLTAGDVVPYAPPGAVLPGGFTLERRKIRGEVSDGMLCSARELGLGDEHDGILHLPTSAGLGEDVRETLGLNDVIFDLDITPNRPDAMCVVGVARDLAAKFGVELNVPEPAAVAHDAPAEDGTVEILDTQRCPRYVAITGSVTVGEAPDWLVRRLTLSGLRPISNVVDATNYVLLERGQPLHAFDRGLLGGGGIRVRRAADGERLTTLDGIERLLTGDDLLICDAHDVPQAIAGVMGGSRAEVHAGTSQILLESAYFQPEGVLRTSKRLGLRTDASARFERGVDPNGTELAARRAWEIMTETAAGAIGGSPVDMYPEAVLRPRITLRTERVNALLGVQVTAEEITRHLGAIGLDVAEGDGPGHLRVDVPTFRPDIEREVDLVEEVARLHGYNRVPRTLPRPAGQVGALTTEQRERRRIRQILTGRGCSEALSLSLVSASDLGRAGYPGVGIELENPLRVEESLLRPAVLPGILRALALNTAHGLSDVQLFEIGHVFHPPRGGAVLPDEREHLAVVLGGRIARVPHEPDRAVELADVVGVVEAIAAALDLKDWALEPARRPGLHPGRSAAVFADGAEVGALGEVAPEVIGAMELVAPVVALEINLDGLLAASRRPRRFQEVSRYPASLIDLAFVVPVGQPSQRMLRTLRKAGGDLLEDVELFDVFQSESLGHERVSLAFRLRFRAADRTLTDQETGALRQACIDAVLHDHPAELRG